MLNPHHAGHEGTEDISRKLQAWSVVVLVGTQQHAESDTAVTVNRYPFHWSLNFGWRRGPLTNRSCGIKILLGHSLPKEMLREVFCPLPLQLQGRAGAARLRTGDMDVLVVASYFAPREYEEMLRNCQEAVQLGREHLRQAWQTSHATVDDKRKRGLRAGSKRRRKKGHHQRKCSGWHQAKRRKQQLKRNEKDSAGDHVARHW